MFSSPRTPVASWWRNTLFKQKNTDPVDLYRNNLAKRELSEWNDVGKSGTKQASWNKRTILQPVFYKSVGGETRQKTWCIPDKLYVFRVNYIFHGSIKASFIIFRGKCYSEVRGTLLSPFNRWYFLYFRDKRGSPLKSTARQGSRAVPKILDDSTSLVIIPLSTSHPVSPGHPRCRCKRISKDAYGRLFPLLDVTTSTL